VDEGRTEDAQQDPQYVSVGEAAKLLGVHRNTVHHRIKTRRLKAHKVLEGEKEVYRIERDSLGVVRPSADVHTLDAQRPTQAKELMRHLTDRLEEIGQRHAIELGDVREQLGEERTRRVLAEERVTELQAELEAERSKGFWRRLFGG
jgi:excisionase family DNA binding protein